MKNSKSYFRTHEYISKRIISYVTVLSVLVCIMASAVSINVNAADKEVRKNYSVVVDGNEICSIMALELNYDNNLYVSMRGIAYALRGTSKAYSISFPDSMIKIDTGLNYDEAAHTFDEEELHDRSSLTLARNKIVVDGSERKYYTLLGGGDAFMAPLTMSMLFDMEIKVNDGEVHINTEKPYYVDELSIVESGYLEGINSLLVGNGTNGEIYMKHAEESVFPIASTTKLMTYYVIMDAMASGQISCSDMVRISSEAEKLSEGIDGNTPLHAGDMIPISELIECMLLASSNECALALAEHVAGTEDNFVQLMNDKAKELSMEEAKFYNCNGLPVYNNQLLTAKMQNRMTSTEMFKMVSALLKDYPEILEITQTKITSLPTLHKDVKNTNAILYNLDEVKGLKTGTTNKSGACLVACAVVEKDGEPNYLISVLFGAEGEYDRSTVSEMTMRLAIEKAKGSNYVPEIEEPEGIPSNPEAVVSKLLKTARIKGLK